MKPDIVIRGGEVVTADAVFRADIAISGEKIVAVGTPDSIPAAARTIDATGKQVIPGAIDSHVHFRTPGYDYKEDWETGTGAAARGGVTTVLEMPNTNPPTGTLEALKLKQSIAAKQAYVDYGIYGLLDEKNLDQLEGLAAAGVSGFKCFMGNTFGDLPAPSDGAMLEGFEILARLGLRCTVHAENASIMARRQAHLEAAGRSDALAHLAARPEVCAIEAVSRAVIFAEWTGARLHIAHKSSQDALYVLRDAKRRGVDVTVETCPQYLLLSTEDHKKLGNVLRVNPPIREPGHQEPLWQALREGVVDMIATDHAPHLPEEKTRPSVWQCDCGFPGVETQMPLMLTEVAKGRMALTDYVRWACVNPAKAWGFFPNKGVIQPGADADLVLLDLKREWSIDQSQLFSRSKISPWHGRRVQGGPVLTMVRGTVVMENGKLLAQPGWGKPAKQKMPPAHPRNVDKTTAAVTAQREAIRKVS
ncbi:MAG TPA: allantoinase AllB [Burkholderiales bacterium]|jgi:dihydroorotase|nr:allantoinase AllB [Burkholderiales bacterium]